MPVYQLPVATQTDTHTHINDVMSLLLDGEFANVQWLSVLICLLHNFHQQISHRQLQNPCAHMEQFPPAEVVRIQCAVHSCTISTHTERSWWNCIECTAQPKWKICTLSHRKESRTNEHCVTRCVECDNRNSINYLKNSSYSVPCVLCSACSFDRNILSSSSLVCVCSFAYEDIHHRILWKLCSPIYAQLVVCVRKNDKVSCVRECWTRL